MIESYANEVLKTKNKLQWERISELEEELAKAHL